MVTSRSVPQQTAQIFSPFAGQNRAALRFSQIGQGTESPERQRVVQQNTPRGWKAQKTMCDRVRNVKIQNTSRNLNNFARCVESRTPRIEPGRPKKYDLRVVITSGIRGPRDSSETSGSSRQSFFERREERRQHP